MVDRYGLFAVGLLGAAAIVLGAFGAHLLKDVLATESLHAYKTANWYHLIHVVALFVIVSLRQPLRKNATTSFWLLTSGTICFSGSIYLLTTAQLWTSNPESVSFLGPITPIGGVLLISGWCHLAWIGLKNNPTNA